MKNKWRRILGALAIAGILILIIFGVPWLRIVKANTSNGQETPTMTAVQTPTPEPTTSSTDTPVVTLQDNGKTITLKVGQSMLLKLGEDYTWTVNIVDQSILSRVKNVMVIRGAQGLYQANQIGETTLTASGDPVCRQATPSCQTPSVLFTIQVVVE